MLWQILPKHAATGLPANAWGRTQRTGRVYGSLVTCARHRPFRAEQSLFYINSIVEFNSYSYVLEKKRCRIQSSGHMKPVARRPVRISMSMLATKQAMYFMLRSVSGAHGRGGGLRGGSRTSGRRRRDRPQRRGLDAGDIPSSCCQNWHETIDLPTFTQRAPLTVTRIGTERGLPRYYLHSSIIEDLASQARHDSRPQSQS